MDLNKIEQVLQSETGMKVCPVCGNPYKPYHSRQKTCGERECKKAYQNESAKKRIARRRAEHPEEFKALKREYARRYRQRKKTLQSRDIQLKDLSEQWEKQLDFDKKISEYGLEYGKRSAEKVLATVPKIDVNIHGKENENEQSVQNEEDVR